MNRIRYDECQFILAAYIAQNKQGNIRPLVKILSNKDTQLCHLLPMVGSPQELAAFPLALSGWQKQQHNPHTLKKACTAFALLDCCNLSKYRGSFNKPWTRREQRYIKKNNNKILFFMQCILWLLSSINSSSLPCIEGELNSFLDQSQFYMDTRN